MFISAVKLPFIVVRGTLKRVVRGLALMDLTTSKYRLGISTGVAAFFTEIIVTDHVFGMPPVLYD